MGVTDLDFFFFKLTWHGQCSITLAGKGLQVLEGGLLLEGGWGELGDTHRIGQLGLVSSDAS